MIDRLSEVELDAAEQFVAAVMAKEERSVVVGGPAQVIAETAQSMIDEIRAHRAARQQALTEEDKEALDWLRKHLRATQMAGVPPRRAKRDALAVLDRLLATHSKEQP